MEHLTQILLLLGLAVVVSFQRLRIPTSLGYLLGAIKQTAEKFHRIYRKVPAGVALGRVEISISQI